MTIKERIKNLEEIALHPAESVRKTCETTGKEAIGCFPIYTPEEIVYAAGIVPIGMWGGKKEFRDSEAYVQGFCCSVIKSNIELGIRGYYNNLKAVIIPSLCDTLKCTIENWKVSVPQVPVIAMVYPQNRWATGAKEYLISEYKRVRNEIEKITGVIISESRLESAYELYEEYRSLMRQFVEIAPKHPSIISPRTRHLIIKASYFMDKANYIKELRAILEEVEAIPEEKTDKIKAVVTGLMAEPVEVLDILDENNICIVCDDLAQESRQFRTISRIERNVWDKMADRILDQRGCTFLAETKKYKGDMLINMVKTYGANAVIVLMMKFCDPEEFDYPVYKKQLNAAGIPVLYIEVDKEMQSFEQIRTRVQGFVEML